jgi:hypothetical protein
LITVLSADDIESHDSSRMMTVMGVKTVLRVTQYFVITVLNSIDSYDSMRLIIVMTVWTVNRVLRAVTVWTALIVLTVVLAA